MSYNGKGAAKLTGASRRKPYNRTRGASASLNAEVLILALRTVSSEERKRFERWYVNGETEESIAASCKTTVQELRAARARLYATYFHFLSLVYGDAVNPAMHCA